MCVANAWYNLIPPSKTVKITMSHIFAVDEQEHYRHFFFLINIRMEENIMSYHPILYDQRSHRQLAG